MMNLPLQTIHLGYPHDYGNPYGRIIWLVVSLLIFKDGHDGPDDQAADFGPTSQQNQVLLAVETTVETDHLPGKHYYFT